MDAEQAGTRIFLLRHAETTHPKVFHGAESDVDLSDKGRRQAAVIAEVLARHRPRAIISSQMLRARETARPIAEACRAVWHVEPLLHERRIGILSGQPWGGTEGIWPETQRRWSAGETGFAHEGAESFDDLRDRVLPVWRRIVARHEGQTTAVVAHGIVCKVLLLTLFPDLTWDSLGSIRNVALSELVHSGDGWTRARINELPPEIQGLGLA